MNTEALQLAGRVAPTFKRKRRKRPITIEVDSAAIRIYRTNWRDPGRRKTYKAFTIAWRDGAGLHREKRNTFIRAKARAQEIGTRLINGQTAMLAWTPADQASYLRCRELAGGVPIEVLIAEAIEARRKNSTANINAKTCPELVEDLLELKRREKVTGAKWLRALESMLERLAEYWTGPLNLMRPHDLNTWLRGLKGGLVYRRHHHAAAVQLVSYAKTVNAVSRADFDIEFWKLVDDPEPPAVTIRVWTPAQLVKLLAHTHPSMIPFTVLQAFAGIRHEELHPEECGPAARDKIPLDWRDVDLEQAHVDIKPETGKTGARLVPLADNLVAWLKPYAKPSGPVCEVKNTSNALTRAKRRAGLPAGKGEFRNVLRKSFGSYRLAVVKNIGQVAEEMGNSPAKIKSNYRKPRPEREGKAWFNVWPTSADILQLDLAGLAALPQ